MMEVLLRCLVGEIIVVVGAIIVATGVAFVCNWFH